jgi:hypothetical protein
MSLGSALLQPQTLKRSSFDDMLALGEDVARVAAIIFEDAAAAGPMAGAVERAFVAVGEELKGSIEPRLRAVELRLRDRVSGPQAALESFAQDVAGLAHNPAAIVGLMRRLLARVKALADSATLPVIRAELEFWKSLVEDDLGCSPEFLSGVIVSFIGKLRTELAAIALTDLAAVRRLRLCESLLVRLGLQAQHLRPPDLDIEPLARTIEEFLRNSGVAGALRELSCALDGIEAAMEGVVAAGGAVRQVLQPLGAGVVPLQESMDYAWYASWLLNDEDLPLLGLRELSDAKAFLLQLKGNGEFERHLRVDLLLPAERTALDGYEGPAEPPKELLLTILAGINRAMQAGPILQRNFDDNVLAASQLTDEIRELGNKYETDQSLFLYNRRVIEKVFQGKVDTAPDGFFHDLGTTFLNTVAWPRNQVFVTGDRRYVMCDDKPIHVGENVKWHEAPLFSTCVRGQMWFDFDHASPPVCEMFAWILAMTAEAVKAILHLVDTQPGHEAPAGTVAAIEIADTIQQLLSGRPVSAYFLEGGPHLRAWGKSLDSFFGLKAIATLASSFQSLHKDAPGDNIFRFWLTVVMGDIIRTLSWTQIANTGRDLILSFLTLWNFRGPRVGSSALPPNPSWNHRKQGAFVSGFDTLFAIALIGLYPRDNYSIYIWSKDGIGDRRRDMFLGHWLGGSLGLGCLAGLTGSFVAQVIAWGEDIPRFFKTGGKSAVKMFLLYWILNTLLKENKTDDGRYKAGGGSFKGYPERDGKVGGVKFPSPYLLPAARGEVLYAGQANLGPFSHNFIANTDFVTPGNTGTQEVYAYDFGVDFKKDVACMRAGKVQSFRESINDSDDSQENQIVIKHTTIDPVHDNFGSGPVQTYAIYMHLAKNGVTNAKKFGGTTPAAGAAGAAVAQGDFIGLAGDTGNSFHNHVHVVVVPDNGSGAPDITFAIPFVFLDVDGDGIPKSRTWYRSENLK